MLKAYELEGLLSLSGFVKGPATALDYQATLNLKNFSAKGPNLKAKPVLNADVQVNTDRLDHLTVDLKAPGTDLQFWAKVVSFTKPQAEFKIASEHGVDLDQWVEFPKKAASLDRRSGVFESDAFAAEDSKAKATASPAADLDASLDSLRTNALLKEMAVEGDVSLAFVKAQNTKIDHILAKLQFKNLIAALSGLSLQVFGGTVKGAFSTDLKPEHPNYTLKLEVSSLDMTKAAEAQFPTFKDTLSGQLSTQIEGGGSSFNTEMAKKKLLMKGSFHLADAKFQSMDISKMVGEALSGSMGKIGDKIPGLKGKKISPPGSINGDTRYEMVSANFTIQNGVLDAPDFYAKSAPKKGIDLKGATKMGLIDQALDAKWEVIDSQHITGADQLSVDLGGKTVKNILAKSENDPVILPITVGCKWSAPCPNYKDVPEFLAGIALSRVTHGAGEAAKKQVTDAVQNAVKNNLGSGLKKIFGH